MKNPKEVVEEILAAKVQEFRDKFERDDGLIDKYQFDDEGDTITTPDAIVSWLKSALSDALSEVLEAAAGEDECCDYCLIPEHDTTGEDYRGAVPDSCGDTDCVCHAHQSQVLAFRDAIRSKIEEV